MTVALGQVAATLAPVGVTGCAQAPVGEVCTSGGQCDRLSRPKRTGALPCVSGMPRCEWSRVCRSPRFLWFIVGSAGLQWGAASSHPKPTAAHRVRRVVTAATKVPFVETSPRPRLAVGTRAWVRSAGSPTSTLPASAAGKSLLPARSKAGPDGVGAFAELCGARSPPCQPGPEL